MPIPRLLRRPAAPSATAPANPTLSVLPGNLQNVITLSGSDGGAAISSYLIERSLDGTTGWTQINAGNPSANPFTHSSGVSNGTSYWYRATATNIAGTSGLSAVSGPHIPTAVTPTVPERPGFLAGNRRPGGEWQFVWEAPYDGGSPITDYRLEWSANGTTGWTEYTVGTSTSTVVVVTGVTAAVYYWRVVAVNLYGDSAPSYQYYSAYPASAQADYIPVTATPGDEQVTLNWAQPPLNGGTLIHYQLRRLSKANDSFSSIYIGTATSYVDTDVDNGHLYTYSCDCYNNIADSRYPNPPAYAIPTDGSIVTPTVLGSAQNITNGGFASVNRSAINGGTIPAGTLLVAFSAALFDTKFGSPPNSPTGFIKMGEQYVTTGNGYSLTVSYKYATASEPSAYTTNTYTPTINYLTIMAFTNAGLGNLEEQPWNQAQTALSMPTPGVLCRAPGSSKLITVHMRNLPSTESFTAPAGMTAVQHMIDASLQTLISIGNSDIAQGEFVRPKQAGITNGSAAGFRDQGSFSMLVHPR